MFTRRAFLTAASLGVAASTTTLPNPTARADLAPSTSSRRPQIPAGQTDLAAYCVGDAKTNDAKGLNRALASLEARGGGTLTIPEKTFLIKPKGWIGVPANVAIVGKGPGSRIQLATDDRKAYTQLFRCDSPNISIESLTLERVSNTYGAFFGIYTKNVYLENVSMQGALSSWENDFSGMKIAGTKSNVSTLTLNNCHISDCGYGVYLSESEFQVVQDILIDGLTATGNHSDDLEFCAPNGILRQIRVKNSKFRANRVNWAGAGFAVGLANAHDVQVSDCSFVGSSQSRV